MQKHRLLVGILALICGVLTLPIVAAAQPVPPETASIQWLLPNSYGYTTLALEIDGQRIPLQRASLQTPAEVVHSIERTTLATSRSHTIKIYGADTGSPFALIHAVEGYRPAPGFAGTVVLTKRGVAAQLPDLVVPLNQSVLRAVNVGQDVRLQLFFGTTAIEFESSKLTLVMPHYDSLELRGGVGGTVQRTLRTQPGFRYDLIVVGNTTEEGAYYDVLVFPVSPQFASQPTATRTFSETGHILEGRFQHYWDTSGGLPIFGLSLNDDHLVSSAEGQFVSQVFERNRFEYHPENHAPYDLLLGRLGDESLRRQGRDWRKEYVQRPVVPDCDAVTTDARVFAVCEPFRSYYRAHGLLLDGDPAVSPAEALALWGLPLTQARSELNSSGDRVLTQYFERARFEYHPNNPSGQQVLLGRLGAEVYDLQPLTFDDEDRNFVRYTNKGGLQEAQGGFGGHFWWGCAGGMFGAGWTGGLSGVRTTHGYAVEVFIPDTHVNSRKASYNVASGDDVAPNPLFLNQKPYANQWVRLTQTDQVYSLFISGTGMDSNCTYQIAIDAIRLIPQG